MGFPKKGYWSGFPFPFWEAVPDPGIEPRSPTLQVNSLPSEPPGRPLSLFLSVLNLLVFQLGFLYLSS